MKIAWIVLAALGVSVIGCDAGETKKQDPGQPLTQKVPSGPPGDCGRVAEALASIKLGNYAEPEARAPEIAKQKSRCEAAKITQSEADCLVKSTDDWTGAQCAPRLFPEIKLGGSGDCKQVTVKLRMAITAQMGAQAQTPQMIKMIDMILPIMERSCIEDQWPKAAIGCILAANANDMKSFEQCSNTMPKSLQDKLQTRMTDAMSKMNFSGQ